MKVCLVFRYAIEMGLRDRIASGEYPHVDFFNLADRLHADVLDFGRVKESRLIPVLAARFFDMTLASAVLAWTRRTEFDVFFISSETAGILLSTFLRFSRKRPRIAIANHHLSSKWKSRFFRLLHLDAVTDAIICMNQFQANFAKTTLRIENHKVYELVYGACVDGSFFTPARAEQTGIPYVLSVGREGRDFETLVKALDTLDIPATIVASGMRGANQYSNLLPTSQKNVKVLRDISYTELRSLYAGCAFVILPLHDLEYPAGITAIMEAMAMGKAVIATRSRGVCELIEDGNTGMWAKVADPEDLRMKILSLWNNPHLAKRMGKNARAFAEERVNLNRYVEDLASILTQLKC